MEPEELVPVSYATGVLLGGFGLDGVSVLFKLGDGLLGVVDFEDPVYLANG